MRQGHRCLRPASPPSRALALGGSLYLVSGYGPKNFAPSTSGRIEANGVLNSLSKAGGRAAGANRLTVGVDANAVEEAGAQLHASLDAMRKPVADTPSIDAATVAVERLKSVLATVSAGAIRVGSDVSGGDTSRAASGIARMLSRWH